MVQCQPYIKGSWAMSPKNNRIIRALQRQTVDRRPLWLMRQAGRYLPEYRKLRQQVTDFMTFCKTPDLACEASLQPLARFDLDAAIVFSDILTLPDAMGMDLAFIKGRGPVINNPIRSEKDIHQLKSIHVDTDLAYVMKTIHLIEHEVGHQLPIIGFAGSPWTVATYMVEGHSNKLFPVIRRMVYQAPNVMHHLLHRLTQVTIEYLNAQIAAGARVVMLFDTWGSLLSHQEYLEFSLAYMKEIAAQLTREIEGEPIPVVFFTKHALPWLEMIAESGCDAVGIDSTIDIAKAKLCVNDRVALQGNLDPFLLFATPSKIQQAVINVLDSFGCGPGLVFNLGHGVDQQTPIDHVNVMIETVHQHSQQAIWPTAQT